MNRNILFLIFVLAGLTVGGGGILIATATGMLSIPSYEATVAQKSKTTAGIGNSASQTGSPNAGGTTAAVAAVSTPVPTPQTNIDDQCHALAGHPEDPNLIGLGVSDAQMDTDAAISACRAAVENQPDNPTLNFQLGRALQLHGNSGESEEYLSFAAQLADAAAMTHYAWLFIDQQNDIETLEALIEYANGSLEGGYQPAKELLDLLNAQLAELQELLNPAFDPNLFQNTEIITALWERDFSALDNITSNFYIEDYGVPKTFSEYAMALSKQMNAPYPIMCTRLLEAGVEARIKSSLEKAITNATVRNPTQSLQMVGGMLQQMLGNGGSMQGMATGMANMNDRVSTGLSISAKLAEQGMKDAITLMDMYGCDGNIPKTIAKNLADYAFGRY